MKKTLLAGILGSALLAMAACAAPLAGADSGSIALMPFLSEEMGIRSVAPLACRHANPGNFECKALTPDQSLTVIVQQAFPGTRDELIAAVLTEVSLEKLPEPTGSYRGSGFTWDLYEFEAQIPDVGPQVLRVDLALAEGDSMSYLVALVTLPDAYDTHTALYDTVFTHVVYALAPLN